MDSSLCFVVVLDRLVGISQHIRVTAVKLTGTAKELKDTRKHLGHVLPVLLGQLARLLYVN
jgi:hypothetical protein